MINTLLFLCKNYLYLHYCADQTSFGELLPSNPTNISFIVMPCIVQPSGILGQMRVHYTAVFACLFVCLFVWSFACLLVFACLFACLFVCLFMCLFIITLPPCLLLVSLPLHTPLCCRCLFLVGCCVNIHQSAAV